MVLQIQKIDTLVLSLSTESLQWGWGLMSNVTAVSVIVFTSQGVWMAASVCHFKDTSQACGFLCKSQDCSSKALSC